MTTTSSANGIWQRVCAIALFVLSVGAWIWAYNAALSPTLNLSIIVGAMVLVFPVIWLGRRALDQEPTIGRAEWVTTGVHAALMVLLGVSIVRAILTHQDWAGWLLPVPELIGRALAIVTGTAAGLAVLNLAVKGMGAPFAVALSQRLTGDWMYAWTRNPMVLATLACLLSVGIWLQSALFVLWVLVLVTPAWLYFVIVYEERELEIRFGEPYLRYKARTSLLFPRRPKA